MISVSLSDGYDAFEALALAMRDEISNEVKTEARNKIGKVGRDRLLREAIDLVAIGFKKFEKQMLDNYNVEPWCDVAKITIDSFRLFYFYNHNYLLGKITKILDGQESC